MPLIKDLPSEDMTSTSANGNDKSTDLAHVCLDAAKNLANVGYNASKSDRAVNNMCLMKFVLPACLCRQPVADYAAAIGLGYSPPVYCLAFGCSRNATRRS